MAGSPLNLPSQSILLGQLGPGSKVGKLPPPLNSSSDYAWSHVEPITRAPRFNRLFFHLTCPLSRSVKRTRSTSKRTPQSRVSSNTVQHQPPPPLMFPVGRAAQEEGGRHRHGCRTRNVKEQSPPSISGIGEPSVVGILPR